MRQAQTNLPLLIDAINAIGGVLPVSRLCGVSQVAVYKWLKNERLPWTEYTGQTNYAGIIAAACRDANANTPVTREALLGYVEQKVVNE